ncbi:MAG: deoxynucleoside kinase [Saprospiraceae bacterium]|jgi:deoxyguanosine kinase|nr:deoxynucleoside kinase [Saprospiraceae bacterium]MBP9209395.1 deoxynucleoside kinase [Saprospiraceae bacterium]MBV6471837.1 Deoxyguanosine kinase [Saprospiraceae bacterium]
MKQFPNKYICIEGNIGAGKSSLCQMLALDYNCRVILEEFADNPFLEYFYKDPARYGLTVELFFLTERQKQIQLELSSNDLFYQFSISDYTILKSLLFARINLISEEYKLFHKIYTALTHSLQKPDLILYLHRDVEQVQRNIEKRGRLFEASIGNDYLDKIQESYFYFFKNQTQFPIVVIDLNEQDFVKNPKIYQELKNIMHRKYPPGLHHVKIINS